MDIEKSLLPQFSQVYRHTSVLNNQDQPLVTIAGRHRGCKEMLEDNDLPQLRLHEWLGLYTYIYMYIQVQSGTQTYTQESINKGDPLCLSSILGVSISNFSCS